MSKLKGAFQRVFKPDISLNILGDLLRAFRKLSFLHFCRWLKNHYDVLLEYLQVKELIFCLDFHPLDTDDVQTLYPREFKLIFEVVFARALTPS